jgi:hypothetical protein
MAMRTVEEHALIQAAGSAFLLTMVESHLLSGGKEHHQAVTIIEGHLSGQMAELRKAFDSYYDHLRAEKRNAVFLRNRRKRMRSIRIPFWRHQHHRILYAI